MLVVVCLLGLDDARQVDELGVVQRLSEVEDCPARVEELEPHVLLAHRLPLADHVCEPLQLVLLLPVGRDRHSQDEGLLEHQWFLRIAVELSVAVTLPLWRHVRVLARGDHEASLAAPLALGVCGARSDLELHHPRRGGPVLSCSCSVSISIVDGPRCLASAPPEARRVSDPSALPASAPPSAASPAAACTSLGSVVVAVVLCAHSGCVSCSFSLVPRRTTLESERKERGSPPLPHLSTNRPVQDIALYTRRDSHHVCKQ